MAQQDSSTFSLGPSPRLPPLFCILPPLPSPSTTTIRFIVKVGAITTVESSSGPTENGRTEAPASSVPLLPRVGDYLGKHRLSAAIGRLHQEIQSLESELEELDKMEPSSAACMDTKGPENSAWERWFQPVRSSRNRKWWSNRDSSFS